MAFTVVELVFAACGVAGRSFQDCFQSESPPHEGVNIVSYFLLEAGGSGLRSASCSTGEVIPFQKLCDVCPISSKRGNILKAKRVHKALGNIIS